MTGPLGDLTIVVPVAPQDGAFAALCVQLAAGRGGAEVIAVGPSRPDGLPPWVRWVDAPLGRARQLNAGARVSAGSWLLFLHADTMLPAGWVDAVARARACAPGALSFFRLRYGDDGPWLTWTNAALANVRASVFGMPFGDQGFLLARETFERLGRFDVWTPAGEDHLLAWRALQRGAGQHTIPLPVVTSARKYAQRGWLRTSAAHVSWTIRQAAPELLTLVRQRVAPDRLAPPEIACFVKTPGLSPVKTRLAASVGAEAAERWYALAVDAREALLWDARARGWSAGWAVAEDAAMDHDRWWILPRTAQGAGDLGARQHRVYDAIRARGRTPVLIGADTPQLSVDRIARALDQLRHCAFVAGEARDGGYDLFAGRAAIPAEVWTSVAYSRPDTLDALERALRPHGRLERLPPLTDVDDLASLRAARAEREPPGPRQAAALEPLWRFTDALLAAHADKAAPPPSASRSP